MKLPPRISSALTLPSRALALSSRELPRDGEQALVARVANHRHDQALGRVRRKADVVVLLADQRRAVLAQRGVEIRELLQREHAGLDDEGERRELDALRLGLRLQLLAPLLQRGDVGLIVLRDVRDVEPARLQAWAGDLPHPGERHELDLAVLRKVHHRDFRQRRAGGSRRLAGEYGLHEGLDVGLEHAALRDRCPSPGSD